MTPQDFAALHARAFSASRAWGADEFAALLQQTGVNWHGDNRAFVLIRHVADEAEILTLATDPAHRRQGLARTILTTAQSAAQQAEIRSIFLEVAEDNTAACALYRQAGYHQVGRRPGYYMPKDGAAIAALVLRKELHAI